MGRGVIVKLIGRKKPATNSVIFFHVHYYHSTTSDTLEIRGLSRNNKSIVDVINTIYAKPYRRPRPRDRQEEPTYRSPEAV